MADGAVQFLLEKLTTLVVQKASLLGDALDEVEEMKLELESMSAFLKDADRRKESDGVGTWVRQVGEVAHDVEDIIDEFMHHQSKHQQHRNGVNGVLHHVLNLPRNIISSHSIALKMQKIKVKVHNVLEVGKRYGFDRIDNGISSNKDGERWRNYGHSSIFIDEDEIVGMEENREKLLLWLTGAEPRQRIISIVGMGGLGKTTLVTNVYNDQLVRRKFDCWAWISVSQNYTIEELLRGMIEEFLEVNRQVVVPRNLGSMSSRQLVNALINYLHQKSYVVVLDDVWSIELWSQIRVAFPHNKLGSRIILTTRNENVAFSVGIGSWVHRLEPLLENDAWILFCNKAFWNNQGRTCPQELQAMAKIILNKCEGLPLAIVSVGGLMSSRDQTTVEWKKVYDSLNWQLSNSPVLESVKGILLLSFNDLPYNLKHCFLYCCVFRDGHAIKRKKLIRLWVAEGFVEERGGMTMEQVGEEYLKELVFRSMIQVTERNEVGRVKTCRVHDVMRELALSTSEKENFCTAYEGKKSRLDGRRIRRLSIHNGGGQIRLRKSISYHLRSFFVFDKETFSSSTFHEISCSFRLLRVLDLPGVVSIETIPDSLVGLFNLRYLNLRDTKIRKLSKSIGRLQNLQSLDVRNTNLETLPNGITQLSNLRHLYMYRCIDKKIEFHFLRSMVIPLGIQNLQNLQTLASIEAKDDEIIEQLGSLSELRRLEVTNLRASNGAALCSSIQKMSYLVCLGVIAESEDEPVELELLCPPSLLQKLMLVGHLKRLPKWLVSLKNLTHLRLGWSRLGQDMLSILQEVSSSLAFLELWKAYEGHELQFRAGWFPSLNKLKLWELRGLNCVRMEEGALRCIREFHVSRCEGLKVVPEGIEHLAGLEMLYLEEMPDELVKRLKSHASEDRCRVQHITTIKHVFRRDQSWIVETLN